MIKLTPQTLKVLAKLVERPDEPIFGAEIIRGTGLRNSTVYPILGRLEEAGWLKHSWESDDAAQVGRQPRKLYCLTPDGLAQARRALGLDVPDTDAARRGLRSDGANEWMPSSTHRLGANERDEDERHSLRELLDRG